MSMPRPALLLPLCAALSVLAGCAPSLPKLTSELAEGEIDSDSVLTVDGWEAEIVLCEQPRLASAWDSATPEERRAFLDVAIELVSQGYDPGASPDGSEGAPPGSGNDATDADHMDHGSHGGHGAGAATVEQASMPDDPAQLADVWRTALAGRAFEGCAGIEARRSSHH